MGNTVDHSERAHSEIGASSAKRWMACPSSVPLSRQFENTSSEAAREGTCAHELAEKALIENKPCLDYVGQEFEGWEVTEDMANNTQMYVDYVNNASDFDNAVVKIEEKIDLSFIDPDMFGSNDCIIEEEYGQIEVIDLKYGKGVEVDPTENPQLMFYALGAAHDGSFSQVKMTIVQPRVDNPIKSWVVPIERVTEQFKQELLYAVERVKAAEKGVDCFEMGDHCRFCLAKAICPAQKGMAMEVTRDAFSQFTEPSLPPASTLTKDELIKILEHGDTVKDWIASVFGYAQEAMERGEEIDGYKLVRGSSRRRFKDEKKFMEIFEPVLGADILQPAKLKGIPALEKIIGKKEMAEFVEMPEGKITLAKVDDKRKAIEISKPKYVFSAFINNNETEKEQDFSNLQF